MNKDPEFIEFMSEEEEMEKLQNTLLGYAKDEGLVQGLVQGSQKEKLEIAKNMIKDNIEINTIKKYTGLSKEEIEKLK